MPKRQLAKALRRLREEAGLTLEEEAPKLDWSSSKLSRLWTEALSACDSKDPAGLVVAFTHTA